jgi:hypothetical protein
MWRRWNVRTGSLLLVAAIAACSADDPVGPITAEPEVAQFVGIWEAEVFRVTNDADPNQVANLLLNEGSFTMNVEESGTYTATLHFGGFPLVEIGQLSISANFVTLRPNGGDPATSEFVFQRQDYLVLDGPTDFDFNLDQILDPAQGHIELQRR